MGQLTIALLLASVAAAASVGGGLLSLWRAPPLFWMSLTFGFAGGLLLGAVSLDMVPLAPDFAGLPVAMAGFVAGYRGHLQA